MTIENQPFQDVSPMKRHRDFPASLVIFFGGQTRKPYFVSREGKTQSGQPDGLPDGRPIPKKTFTELLPVT